MAFVGFSAAGFILANQTSDKGFEDTPDENSFAELDKKSSKFKKLHAEVSTK